MAIDLASGTPAIWHWGRDLGDLGGSDVRALLAPAIGHSDFDEPVVPGAWREGARGFLGRSALTGHRSGLGWSPRFAIEAVEATADRLSVSGTDADAGLRATWALELTDQGVLLVSQGVRNDSDSDYVVDDLTVWLPLPAQADEVLDFTGRWCLERTPQRQPIRTGTWAREIREGRSGHDGTIVQVALTSLTGFGQGEAWSVGLLWSGNARNSIERLPDGSTSIGAGELLLPGEVVLGPGESYDAPVVAAAYSDEGLDGISARYHSWLRARPGHPTRRRPRPLTLNVWEAVYFDHRPARLTELADVAAEIGVERFVLDDGWFHGRRDDRAGLGDWWVDASVWPDGLGPLVDHVTSLGMQFGLWFEPEMANADSDLLRAHPDWILQMPGRTPPEWRHQQVLDLGQPAVYEYIRDRIHEVLTDYAISYIKWDHNRVLVDGGHLGRPGARSQTLAAYRLMDELKALHPGLEIESCASGGARVDLGMAMHADRFWASDSNDALDRVSIQRWTGLAIPPELLGTHIGPPRAHTTGRTHDLDFRATTALFGHAGIEWDITGTTPAERLALASWAAFYKENRGLLHAGTVVRMDGHDDASLVHGVVAPDRDRALFAVVQLRMGQASRPQRIVLRGLDPDARYLVREVTPAGAPPAQEVSPPPWTSGITVSGRLLETVGLPARILQPEHAMLILLERASSSRG